jgi:hypothetical protein
MYLCKGPTGCAANILLTITIAKCLDPLRHYYCCRPANPLISRRPQGYCGRSWSTIVFLPIISFAPSTLTTFPLLHISIMSSSLDEPKVSEGVQSDLDDGGLGKQDDFTPDSVATASRISPAESRGVPLSHEGDGVVPPTIPETSPVRNQSQQDQTTEGNGIMSEQTASSPPSPPSFANIHPLSAKPTDAQYDFIESYFTPESRRGHRLLSRKTYKALKSKDLSRIDAAYAECRKFYSQEAERIFGLYGEGSQTAVPSSQPETDQGPPIDADQTQDDTSTKAPETAHEQ